jgi:hypothetical protein
LRKRCFLSWNKNQLSPDSFSEFVDNRSLLNEFTMMWSLRELFPLHFIVFKQTGCHLSHETNVEQVFSRTGNLSDPNMDPEYLAHLVMVWVNKKSYKLSTANVKDKYYELFRSQGGKGLERNELKWQPLGWRTHGRKTWGRARRAVETLFWKKDPAGARTGGFTKY